MNNVYIEHDLIKEKLCTQEQLNEIIEVSKKFSIDTILDGKSVTSREDGTDCEIPVKVVFGDIISEKLDWLVQLYQNQFKEFASEVSKIPMSCSESQKSCMNINTLEGVGARYEWHVDSNPVTGLLFVTTHKDGEGGELIFRLDEKDIIINPKSGVFIAFDAREIPHTVMPLKVSGNRISVPMNFYIEGKSQIRPDDLDTYLESKSQ